MIAELSNGGVVNTSTKLLKDWMIIWLNTYLPNIEATTRQGYMDSINNHIIPHLGNINLKSLSANSIQLWVNYMQNTKKLAPKTIKNTFLNLKAALDKVVVLHMIPHNPCSGVVLPKLTQRHKRTALTLSEVNQLLSVTKGTDMYLIILLLVYIGLRRGELIALQWDDIDFDNKVIHIHRNTTMADGKKICKSPKTDAGIRDINIEDNLLSELKKAQAEYLKKKMKLGKDFIDSNLVICKEDGSGYRPDSLTQKWERFIKQQPNITQICLHELRHTCASLMVGAGVPLKTVQNRLGHSDISITLNVYTHTTQESNKQASKTMENMLAI